MLDEKLFSERLQAFQPEPLIPDSKPGNHPENVELQTVTDPNTIDLAKSNFLNLLDNEDIKKACESIIREYGVGTCGPRAFYGTTDKHLELEEKIAKFLNMKRSIVYSYGFVAISSSIAAYCKPKDTVFVDKNANFAILQGLKASRCKVVYFDTYKPETLQIAARENQTSSRKFLIIEAISWNTGKLALLPDLIDIAEEFRMRIFVEETYSIGILGENGRGITEHYKIDLNRIDMIFGTLEAALGSIGGFCAGSELTIDHQELSGSGYIFSASLPTFLCEAVIQALDLIEENPGKLVKFALEFHDFLQETGYEVLSDKISPFKLFTAPQNTKESIKKIHEYCQENHLQIINNEEALKINLNVQLGDDLKMLNQVKSVLKEALVQLT